MTEAKRNTFYLKFIEPQFLDSFLEKGTIHLSRLGYFIDLENETGDDIIGDRLEGAWMMNMDPEVTKLTIIRANGEKIVLQGAKDGIVGKIRTEVTNEMVRDWGILSMCHLDLSEDGYFSSVNEKKHIGKMRLRKEVVNELYQLSDNGNRIPVLFDVNKFIELLMRELQGKHAACLNDVTYYSENDDENISLK
ncbi:hypothetical protein [Levilactobacillus namurensis]|uniref:Uncharacterized protein n=1 Tax=Levilactobacillus namurensis TaxID=380393 RepID=A0AAW8W3K6_9LACO|nr:hypothetical protein [Levilactobacillus namurensis]MDT7013313.1 hypothetical protein [Levilactobacillus namurensis]